MKPIKLISIILAGVIIVFVSAAVVSLINQHNPRTCPELCRRNPWLQEPSAPSAVEKAPSPSKPIQPSEPVAQKPVAVKVKPE